MKLQGQRNRFSSVRARLDVFARLVSGEQSVNAIADLDRTPRSVTSKRHIVIVGGGFGGLACAKALAGSDVHVTLIDKRNHHLFQPLLYQVATAALSPADIAEPIRRV